MLNNRKDTIGFIITKTILEEEKDFVAQDIYLSLKTKSDLRFSFDEIKHITNEKLKILSNSGIIGRDGHRFFNFKVSNVLE